MSRPKSALEIFRLLERSNCKECGEKTCLAFAGAVFTGQRRLRECPRLTQEAVEGFAEEADNQGANERSPEEYLKKLFQKRCEEPMKRVADTYRDLFDDMVHVFSGRQVDKQFESEISVVLHPLPKVPIMICYWLPDEGLASSLHVFFDETADRNLGIGPVFTLETGLAQMFTKLALRHGFAETAPTMQLWPPISDPVT